MQPAKRLWLAATLIAALPAPAAACTISAPGVAFGAYNPLAAGHDNSTATITVLCATSVTAPIVALSTGGSGTYSPRRLAGTGFNLNYNLYTNSGRTIVWGDGSGGSVTQTLSGGTIVSGQRRFRRTVYGRITALQNVGAGAYSDTITLTVTF
jgi:spore coat protein U-like protein